MDDDFDLLFPLRARHDGDELVYLLGLITARSTSKNKHFSLSGTDPTDIKGDRRTFSFVS